MNVCPLSEKDKSYPRFFMECNRITNTTLHKQYGITWGHMLPCICVKMAIWFYLFVVVVTHGNGFTQGILYSKSQWYHE